MPVSACHPSPLRLMYTRFALGFQFARAITLWNFEIVLRWRIASCYTLYEGRRGGSKASVAISMQLWLSPSLAVDAPIAVALLGRLSCHNVLTHPEETLNVLICHLELSGRHVLSDVQWQNAGGYHGPLPHAPLEAQIHGNLICTREPRHGSRAFEAGKVSWKWQKE
ncbi:hypothetical protein Vi05172_g8364 [Venturia inaequalis]|nr:hypothetical protein Vi05172_g8364 [Venturia inaequalis]